MNLSDFEAEDDPVRAAAQALALTMAYFRDLLTDPAYAAILVHFQALTDALPTADDLPAAASA